MNFQPPEEDDPRDDAQRWEDAQRAAFEADAEPMGFDLTRFQCAAPEPWSEYANELTGHRWGGWLAALASAQPAPQGWRTIESAPRDDSVLLSDGCTVGEGFWHDGSQCHGHRGGAGWFWESDRGDLLIASNAGATHWMPLPPPPALPLAGDAPLQGEG